VADVFEEVKPIDHAQIDVAIRAMKAALNFKVQ
jgi:hypothetical protein